ncbi:MAG: hypothetical protein FJ035_05680 [Chloroflexi bacterium]|nr:hypothetical protein [Chloroflexota bacterium]
MTALSLGDNDARIVYVAAAYHLGRPGAEAAAQAGLAPVFDALAAQFGRAQTALELSPYQLGRLDEALLGLTNELKQYDLAGRRTAVPGLAEAIARCFPELAPGAPDEGASALDLVADVVALRRRLGAALAASTPPPPSEPDPAPPKRPEGRSWWRRMSRS